MKKILILSTVFLSSFVLAATIATWTSTCGVINNSTYPSNWTDAMIENDIKNINESQCGVRPDKVTFTKKPSTSL